MSKAKGRNTRAKAKVSFGEDEILDEQEKQEIVVQAPKRRSILRNPKASPTKRRFSPRQQQNQKIFAGSSKLASATRKEIEAAGVTVEWKKFLAWVHGEVQKNPDLLDQPKTKARDDLKKKYLRTRRA